MRWRRKWQPTPVFLPGVFQGWRSLVGCPLWGRTESDPTEATKQQQQQQQGGVCQASQLWRKFFFFLVFCKYKYLREVLWDSVNILFLIRFPMYVCLRACVLAWSSKQDTINDGNWFLTVLLEAGRSEIRVLGNLVPVEGSLPGL